MKIRGYCLLVIAALMLVVSMPGQADETGDDFVVTLLGTGTPPPLVNRFGPATLVEVGGKMFLFDAGRGATQQMWQLKKSLGQLEALILTHLHSDHVVGVPDVWLTGWLRGPFGRRDDPFRVIGPEGTENLMKHLQLAYAWDVDTRVIDQKLSREAGATDAKDVEPGVVYDQDGVTISAFANDHGQLINPSFGYRIDYDGRSVVISVIDAATGADLLVHSIGAAKQELLDSSPVWRVIMAHHIQPEEAGEVFSEAQPKLAVYTHVVSLTNGKIPPVKPDEIMERTRTTYDGPLVMGQDLMTIMVGKDEVTATPFQP